MSGPTTVWLARHGEVRNPRNLLYGRLPRWGLSAEGRRQAEALAGFLADRPLAAIYASPMLRARKTAEVVRAQHPALRVRLTRELIELKSGWEGRPQAELAAIGWDYYANPFHAEDETIEQIRDRMLRWVRRVVRRHAGGEVVGVSHGDPLLVALAALRGLPMELASIRPAEYIPTACVFRLRFDAGRFLDDELFTPHARAAP